jgi:hypothetical protein
MLQRAGNSLHQAHRTGDPSHVTQMEWSQGRMPVCIRLLIQGLGPTWWHQMGN